MPDDRLTRYPTTARFATSSSLADVLRSCNNSLETEEDRCNAGKASYNEDSDEENQLEPLCTGRVHKYSYEEKMVAEAREDRWRNPDKEPNPSDDNETTAFEDENPNRNEAAWAAKGGDGIEME